MIKKEKEYTDCFLTERGLRQGCPLSPLLFILYIADVEEFLKKKQEAGTGKMKISTLAYADDNNGGIRKRNRKDAESIKEISRRKRTATKCNKIKDDGMQQERQTKTLKKWKNSSI